MIDVIDQSFLTPDYQVADLIEIADISASQVGNYRKGGTFPRRIRAVAVGGRYAYSLADICVAKLFEILRTAHDVHSTRAYSIALACRPYFAQGLSAPERIFVGRDDVRGKFNCCPEWPSDSPNAVMVAVPLRAIASSCWEAAGPRLLERAASVPLSPAVIQRIAELQCELNVTEAAVECAAADELRLEEKVLALRLREDAVINELRRLREGGHK